MKAARLFMAGLALVVVVLAGAGCDDDDDLTGGEMYITPASYTFGSGADRTVSLRVFGAQIPLRWSVSDSAMGTLSGITAGEDTNIDAANYTRIVGKYGRNTVIVTDSRGWQASSVMNVPERLDDATNGAAFYVPAGR